MNQCLTCDNVMYGFMKRKMPIGKGKNGGIWWRIENHFCCMNDDCKSLHHRVIIAEEQFRTDEIVEPYGELETM